MSEVPLYFREILHAALLGNHPLHLNPDVISSKRKSKSPSIHPKAVKGSFHSP